MAHPTFDTQTDAFEHRQFRDDEFWRQIPAWSDVSRDQFGDRLWQGKNSVRNLKQVHETLGDRIGQDLLQDIEAALRIPPMNIRSTHYVLALIDWENPVDDPLRKQFLPIASQMLPDHPYYLADSLSEDVDAPVPMLPHHSTKTLKQFGSISISVFEETILDGKSIADIAATSPVTNQKHNIDRCCHFSALDETLIGEKYCLLVILPPKKIC